MGERAIRQCLLVAMAEVDYAICEFDGEAIRFHYAEQAVVTRSVRAVGGGGVGGGRAV